jgi:hypothetical protein
MPGEVTNKYNKSEFCYLNPSERQINRQVAGYKSASEMLKDSPEWRDVLMWYLYRVNSSPCANTPAAGSNKNATGHLRGRLLRSETLVASESAPLYVDSTKTSTSTHKSLRGTATDNGDLDLDAMLKGLGYEG